MPATYSFPSIAPLQGYGHYRAPESGAKRFGHLFASADRLAPDVTRALASDDDSPQTVSKPSDPNIRYIRARFDVWFAGSLSGPETCRLLERHHARVVGGFRDAEADVYTIGIPDPGVDWTAWEVFSTRLQAEPGLLHVYGIAYGGTFQAREPG